ncbi:uncharacterized protein LOC115376493 isoform X3 [Myripristis murdjan]|uniref:uncharacterized protein LOC115376493 isoform X3 n=1 Tax=Myripristis murdjan TaxID=586833 RepID=UPI00117640D0|nr:uncharacterized protein LOC115376493 isoform X3 [Myripristis murdjan]
MTAPSTGHPVAITLGVAWTIKLDPGQPTHPRLTVAATIELAALTLARVIFGDVWIFSVYQPNYDPTAADGLYCNKTLYTFAFWNAIWESMKFAFLLAKFCQGLLCCVLLQEPPAAAERDFYRNV